MSDVDEDGVVIEQPGQLQIVEPGALEALNRAEIDVLVSTARKYPRTITDFRREALNLVTLDETVAGECTYSLPRGGKKITGPSVRFAEMIAHAWGNCRAGARVVNVGTDFVTAQGFFADLQKNVAFTFEVQRRITDKDGKRYNDDMIGMTGNAACSIAMRNAVFHGVPKALWRPLWERSIAAAKGTLDTLEKRRAMALKVLAEEFKVDVQRVCAALDVSGPGDIGLDQLLDISQRLASVRTNEASIEEVFPSLHVAKEKKTEPAKSARDLAAEQAKNAGN